MTSGDLAGHFGTTTVGSLDNWFLARRLQLRLTQREVARRLNMTPATVWNWERDRTAPDLRRAESIASVYDVSVAEAQARIVEATGRVGAIGGARAD